MRRFIREAGVCLLVLTSVATAPLAAPHSALAGDASITTCDEAAFDAALAEVQTTGGGTITFDCSEVIEFSTPKLITTDVTIKGYEVKLDGGDGTHLFEVASGARLALFDVGLRNGNGGADYGGAITNFGTVEITFGTLSNNHSDNSGGTIRNFGHVAIDGAKLIYNSSGQDGGALFNASGATTTIVATEIASNQAAGDGGAIRNNGYLFMSSVSFTGNSANSSGGAITSNDAAFTSIDSTLFRANTTAGSGGAVRNGGEMNILASTFTSNSAGNRGGAIRNGGSLWIISTTFTGNGAPRGGALHEGGTTSVRSTILANSSYDGSPVENCSDALTSLGMNLSDDSSCALNHLTDTQDSASINLGPLADNGGATLTHMPLNGSAALDNANCFAVSNRDQRLAQRPDSGCDIGAVEAEAAVPARLLAFAIVSNPVDEGDVATLLVLGFGPDNANLSFNFDCDGDRAYETPGVPASSASSRADCTLTDDGTHTLRFEVCDAGDSGSCETSLLRASVDNVAPRIVSVTTNAPVPQGQPATVTVEAADPGVDDVLSYSFDCDNDGAYEIDHQAGNQAQCQLDPGVATTTIGIQVSDDDGGVTEGSVTVGQALAVCVNRYTGALTAPSASGGCPMGTRALALPMAGPTTLCSNLYTGALTWSPQGTCGGYRTHVVPDDGPLYFCQSIYTGQLRYAASGTCSAFERPGVIPG